MLDKIFSTPEEQGRIINDIIEKGRKEGVDEMEIEFHDKGGFNLNAPIDGCKVDVHIGKDQNVRLNVRYKK